MAPKFGISAKVKGEPPVGHPHGCPGGSVMISSGSGPDPAPLRFDAAPCIALHIHAIRDRLSNLAVATIFD